MKGVSQRRSFCMKNTAKLIGIIALAAIIVLGISCRPREGSAPVANGSSATTTVVTGGNAIDRLLDEWEKLVEDYTAITQRMMTGDVAAAAEWENYSDLFDNLEAQLDDLSEDDFTPAQAARLGAIMARLTEGLSF